MIMTIHHSKRFVRVLAVVAMCVALATPTAFAAETPDLNALSDIAAATVPQHMGIGNVKVRDVKTLSLIHI